MSAFGSSQRLSAAGCPLQTQSSDVNANSIGNVQDPCVQVNISYANLLSDTILFLSLVKEAQSLDEVILKQDFKDTLEN